MHLLLQSALGLALVAFLSSSTLVARAASAEPSIEELEQKVKILERKAAIGEEEAAKKKLETPIVTAGPKGFALTSPDKDKSYEFKLRGNVQFDGRFVSDDEDETFNNTFLVRRVRPIFEGTLGRYFGFRIMPDFAGTPSLLDAYGEVNFLPQLRLRAGKFKGPVGLERLQSQTDLRFNERGLPTNLAPNRDVGIMLHGDLFDFVVNYSFGVFNGTADGASSVEDLSDNKDIEGRIFLSPFFNRFGPFQGLGVGLAGTWGDPDGTGDLGRYRTQAQQTFFSYRGANTTTGAGPATADGTRYRLAPQAYWYFRSYGLLAEYTRSTQEVSLDAEKESLSHDAWQLLASWVITGEDNSFKSVQPRAPFNPWNGTWGAWEVAARYGQLDVDNDTFPIFANPNSSATKNDSWGIGVNWYLNTNVRVYTNFEQSRFDGGGASGADRPNENAFFTRLQTSF